MARHRRRGSQNQSVILPRRGTVQVITKEVSIFLKSTLIFTSFSLFHKMAAMSEFLGYQIFNPLFYVQEISLKLNQCGGRMVVKRLKSRKTISRKDRKRIFFATGIVLVEKWEEEFMLHTSVERGAEAIQKLTNGRITLEEMLPWKLKKGKTQQGQYYNQLKAVKKLMFEENEVVQELQMEEVAEEEEEQEDDEETLLRMVNMSDIEEIKVALKKTLKIRREMSQNRDVPLNRRTLLFDFYLTQIQTIDIDFALRYKNFRPIEDLFECEHLIDDLLKSENKSDKASLKFISELPEELKFIAKFLYLIGCAPKRQKKDRISTQPAPRESYPFSVCFKKLVAYRESGPQLYHEEQSMINIRNQPFIFARLNNENIVVQYSVVIPLNSHFKEILFDSNIKLPTVFSYLFKIYEVLNFKVDAWLENLYEYVAEHVARISIYGNAHNATIANKIKHEIYGSSNTGRSREATSRSTSSSPSRGSSNSPSTSARRANSNPQRRPQSRSQTQSRNRNAARSRSHTSQRQRSRRARQRKNRSRSRSHRVRRGLRVTQQSSRSRQRPGTPRTPSRRIVSARSRDRHSRISAQRSQTRSTSRSTTLTPQRQIHNAQIRSSSSESQPTD